MHPTDDVVTAPVLLQEVFGCEPDDEPLPGMAEGAIPVCAGEWRRRPDNRWQFWANDEAE
jgi:hypothetical protein